MLEGEQVSRFGRDRHPRAEAIGDPRRRADARAEPSLRHPRDRRHRASRTLAIGQRSDHSCPSTRRLDTLLLTLAGRDLTAVASPMLMVDCDSSIQPRAWGGLLDLAVGEIRHYGADSPQIARRLQALLLNLKSAAPQAVSPPSSTSWNGSTPPSTSPSRTRSSETHAAIPDRLGIGATPPPLAAGESDG